MQDRGAIVRNAINKQGYKVTKIAEQLGRSRRSMYDLFNKNNVSLDLIIEIEKIIHYDFTDEIKELKKYRLSHDLDNTGEKEQVYDKDYWRNKYFALLEKHNDLMESITPVKAKKAKAKK